MIDPITIEKLRLPTPFYYYDIDLLNNTLTEALKHASRHHYILHYALKANSNPKILKIISGFGLGADCVGGNEILTAVENGFPAGQVVFAGVGKSDEEIAVALENDIQSLNVESVQELEVINELAAARNRIARIALRIIPNIDPHTHHFITTGLEENKFGIHPWEFDSVIDKLKALANVKFTGLHFHIGSQITDNEVFKSLCSRVNEISRWFTEHRLFPGILNLGGGFGVDYSDPDKNAIPDFASYFTIFKRFLEPQAGQQVHFEPGRALVAQCGTLVTKVNYVKSGIHTRFAIVDAGMNDLIRPALYQSYHKIENLTSTLPPEKYDVVGPICESSDCFGKAVLLPQTRRGDILAIRSAGAYGQTMASRYNLRDLAPAYYSDEINLQ
jgi:diaminopimelate decarboxylase